MKIVTYGDIWHLNEVEQSAYSFDLADTDMLFTLFEMYEKEAKRICEEGYNFADLRLCVKMLAHV